MNDTSHEHEGGVKGGSFVSRIMSHMETVFDFFAETLQIIVYAKELFIGAAFTTVGLMNFQSDKFCDGNTADYLSCTRPSTYYYYDWFAITLVLIGITLLLVWHVRGKYRA